MTVARRGRAFRDVAPAGEAGFTLIELLIAMVVGSTVLAVLAASLLLGFRATGDAEERLFESHDAQLLATTLSADLQSVSPGGVETDGAVPTGCAGPSPGVNVLRLQWAEEAGATTTRFSASYRYEQVGDEWQLIRWSCEGPDLAVADADDLVVAHALHPTIAPVAVGTGVDRGLLLTLASGYQFTITGSRRTATTTSTSTTLPPTPSPTLLSAAIRDVDVDGKVDQIHAEFDAVLSPGNACTTGWSATALPTMGTLGAVTVSGTNVTVDVTEGSVPDTAWPGVTISFDPASGCNGAAATLTRTDEAAPVLTAVTTTVAGIAGRLQTGDVLTLTLSEAVSGVPSTVAVVEEDRGPGDVLRIGGLLDGDTDLGSKQYMSRLGSSTEATFAAAVTNVAGVISVTVGLCSTGCTLPTTGIGDVSFAIAPAIQDDAGLSVAAALSLTGFRVF